MVFDSDFELEFFSGMVASNSGLGTNPDLGPLSFRY